MEAPGQRGRKPRSGQQRGRRPLRLLPAGPSPQHLGPGRHYYSAVRGPVKASGWPRSRRKVAVPRAVPPQGYIVSLDPASYDWLSGVGARPTCAGLGTTL
jgi:hypothetical protein